MDSLDCALPVLDWQTDRSFPFQSLIYKVSQKNFLFKVALRTYNKSISTPSFTKSVIKLELYYILIFANQFRKFTPSPSVYPLFPSSIPSFLPPPSYPSFLLFPYLSPPPFLSHLSSLPIISPLSPPLFPPSAENLIPMITAVVFSVFWKHLRFD